MLCLWCEPCIKLPPSYYVMLQPSGVTKLGWNVLAAVLEISAFMTRNLKQPVTKTHARLHQYLLFIQ